LNWQRGNAKYKKKELTGMGEKKPEDDPRAKQGESSKGNISTNTAPYFQSDGKTKAKDKEPKKGWDREV